MEDIDVLIEELGSHATGSRSAGVDSHPVYFVLCDDTR
jgi:hypothetical protein